MAKKDKVKKEKETKEESKVTFNDIKKKCLKYIKENKENTVKATVSFVVLLLVVIVGIAAVNAVKENSLDNIDYPLVYRKDSGEIMLLKSQDKTGKDATVLSLSDGTGYTTYGNTSNRYVLTKKGADLYIYDTKKEEKPSKISDDASYFGFSKKDSYVYVVDMDGDLYSYDYKNAKKKLDGKVSSVRDYSDKAIIYERDSKLYYNTFKTGKNDRKVLIEKYVIAEFSEDGKAVLYTNANNALYRYDIKKDKHTKIGSKVDRFYCDDASCKKIFYTSSEKEYSLYYYNGKKSTVVAENIYDIKDIDVDEKQVIYSKFDEKNMTKIYYQKVNSKPREIASDYTINGTIKLLKNEIYYINKKRDLKYIKINGSNVGKTKVIDKEVESSLMDLNDGFYYYKNSNKKDEATYYIAKSGKVKKIADDISDTRITVSNNGEKLYYIKDLENNSGTLYVYENGKNIKISDSVYRFLYIRDDSVYYLKKYDIDKRIGQLYRYDGKSTKIEEKVSDLSSTPNAYLNK